MPSWKVVDLKNKRTVSRDHRTFMIAICSAETYARKKGIPFEKVVPVYVGDFVHLEFSKRNKNKTVNEYY